MRRPADAATFEHKFAKRDIRGEIREERERSGKRGRDQGREGEIREERERSGKRGREGEIKGERRGGRGVGGGPGRSAGSRRCALWPETPRAIPATVRREISGPAHAAEH